MIKLLIYNAGKVKAGKVSNICGKVGKVSQIEYGMIKKVQVGKDQEKAQSEKDSHSKNRGGKKPN